MLIRLPDLKSHAIDMNLKSLLQSDMSDLKNVKLDDVRSKLQSRPMTVIRLLLVIMAVGAVIFGWSTGNKRKQELITELGEKQKKLQIFQELQLVKNDYDSFLKALPKPIDRDSMIKEISELAEKKEVQIVSFVPGERKLNDLVKANILEMNINADSYENLTGFIESIERSPYLMRVEKWSGRMVETMSKDGKQTVRKIVDARLEIAGLVIATEFLPVK